MKHIVERRISEGSLPLPCVLTPAERVEKGHELALELQKLEAHDQETTAMRADSKATREAIVGKVNALRDVVASGSVEREVVVDVMADDEEGVVRTYRRDTGAVVMVRPLQAFERQVSIPGTDRKLAAVDGGKVEVKH